MGGDKPIEEQNNRGMMSSIEIEGGKAGGTGRKDNIWATRILRNRKMELPR